MEHLSENRRARFDYDIADTLEAGVELLGTEVKSAKAGRAAIAGSRIILRGEELWLVGADIPAHQPKNAPADYDPSRSRRLLLHREEIARLGGKLKEKGIAIVPLALVLRRGKVKVQLAVARGRKKADKREAIKKKGALREMRRED